MAIEEMQQAHLDFLSKMCEASIGSPSYSVWANAYDRYLNSLIRNKE